jgi:23S rRNA A2030 N6-methylase RlmJ
MVFIDLRTAYDNINRRRLYGILAQQSIAKKVLDWKEGVCQTMAQVKVREALQRYLNYVVDEINAVDRRHCNVL